MACHVIRLSAENECGACGREVATGYAIITDEIESPVWVPVCEGCSGELDGWRKAVELQGEKRRAGRRD